jgi:pilus assembly protein CpaB
VNRRLISVVLFGMVIAGGASLVLYRLMLTRAASGNAPAALNMSQIVVAARDLEPGAIVKDADLKMVAWPSPLPAGSFIKMSDISGRCVAASIFAGEPIAEPRLAPVGSGGGLTAMIPQGMRAVAIRVNEVVGVAGFVVAGTHVDVLVSGNRAAKGDGPADTVTRTILQDITVLSAGQDYKQNADGKPATVQVVNLLVTPPQAETLSLAGSQATVQLVLRNPMDKAIVDTPGTVLASILGGAPPAAHPPVAPRRPAVQPVPTAIPAPRSEEPIAMEIIQGNRRIQAVPQTTGDTK